MSVWDYRYPAALANLAVGLHDGFCHLGDLRDLEEANSRQRDALELTLGGYPDKAVHLNNLDTSSFTRFKRPGG